MALNRDLRKDLLEKLGVTRQRLSQKAKAIKVAHGPMSTDDAVYVLAHQAGFDLSKYLVEPKTSLLNLLKVSLSSSDSPLVTKPEIAPK